MIDSHVHIIPGVDDGSKNAEMSATMLACAKSDGINRWIFTPHYNHLCCRLSYDELKSHYESWLSEGGHGLTRDNTRFGVEVYIDEAFMAGLPTMAQLPTFDNSQYMLCEFNRNAKFERMLEVVYELRLKGVIPIIAHIEMYADLVRRPETVKALCNEGALVQVSASSIVGGKYKRFIDILVRQNTVDFVASDGHNLTSRPPQMRKAYDWVAKTYSRALAERLFVESPQILFDGGRYIRPALTLKRKWRLKVAVAVVGLIALALIGLNVLRPQSDVGHAVASGTETGDQQGEVATTDDSTEPFTESDTETDTEIETEAETTTQVYGVDTPAYDDVVALYRSQLEALQEQYTADVQRLFEAVQNTRQFISDQEKRNALIESYLLEAGALEEKCDLDVYAILYDFQNALEKHKYPVAIIESSRAAYHQIKEETKQQYLSEL